MKRNSVIREMLYGGHMAENIKMGERYDKLFDKLVDINNQLERELQSNERLSELYEKFKEVNDEVLLEELARYFEEGVKFGVLFGIEVASK